jgi:Tfp pilus assembly protein PilO
MEKMRQWSILTAVAVLALLVGGWFLLVSPQRSHAASLRSQANDQNATNDSLQSRIQQLQQQKLGLPAQQRLLNQIAAQVPNNPELPTLIRQLSRASTVAGVDLVSMAPSTPALVAPPLAATSTSVPATTTTTTTSSSSAAAPAAPVAANLARIPLVLTVQGSYANIEKFFHSVEKLGRATLVQQFTLVPAAGAGATGAGGKPLPADTLTATINASVFESPDVLAPTATTVAPVAPAAPAQ